MSLAAARPIFVTVFLIVMIISTAITFILPESYAGTARVKVEVAPPAAGPYFFPQTEFEVIQSQIVLDKAIEKLNLNVEWGKKYFNGETLKTAESLQILKGRLSLAPVRDTKLIAITVYSDDRREAAAIANAIATAYQDFYLEKQRPEAAKAAAGATDAPVVTIIDTAEPAAKPCKPNKPLNIALGALAGMILGSVAAGVFGLFQRR